MDDSSGSALSADIRVSRAGFHPKTVEGGSLLWPPPTLEIDKITNKWSTSVEHKYIENLIVSEPLLCGDLFNSSALRGLKLQCF